MTPRIKPIKPSATAMLIHNRQTWNRRTWNRQIWSCGVAIALVGVALLLMLAIDAFVQVSNTPYLLFYAALTLSALYGERNAGFLATLLSAFCVDYFFIEPRFQFNLSFDNFVKTAFFILIGGLLSILVGRLCTAQEQTAYSLEQLQATEARFRRLIDSNIIGVASGSVDGTVWEANDEFLRLTQFTREDVLSGRVQLNQLTPAQDCDRDQRTQEKLLEQGKHPAYETTLIDKTGQPVPVMMGAALLQDRSDEVISFVLDLRQQQAALQERERAKAALQEREVEFRTLFEVTSVGTAQVDPTTRQFLDVNAAFCEMTGYTEAELLAMTIDDINHPDDRDRDRERFMRVMQGEASGYYQSEKRYVRKDGSIVWVLATGNAVRNQAGQPCRTVAVIQDITERQQAEMELRSREAQLQTLFDAAPIGIFLIDQDFRVRQVNPIARPTFGDIPDLIGRDFEEVMQILWQSDDADEVIAHYRHTLETREPYYVPERIKERRDRGVVEYYEWEIHRIPLPDCQFGVVCYFRDISAQVLARQAIERSEERLSLAVNNAGMATWDVDLQTGQTSWSENHFTLLGYEPRSNREVTDDLWRDRLHPEDIDAVMQAVEVAKQDRSLCQVEYRIIRADNRAVRWISAFARFAYNEAGQPVRFIGIFFDVTDRKLTDLEIQRLNRDLARRADDLQTILDVLPVGVAIADDPSCKVIRVNRFSQNMLRIPPDGNASVTANDAEILPFRLLRNGEAIPAHELPMELAVAQKQPVQDIEIQMVRSDGERLDGWVNAVPLLDEAGNVRGCVAALMNITELRRIEADLQENRLFLQQIAEALPGMLYVHDVIKGCNVYTNRRSIDLIGYTPEQMAAMGENVLQTIVHPDDLPQVLAYQAAFSSAQPGEILGIEHRSRHANGEWRWFSSRSLVFKRTPTGEAHQVLGVSFDITAAKHLEAARRQTEAKLQETLTLLNAISDHSLDMVFAKDTAGQLLFVNPVISQIFGKPTDELIGKDEYYFIEDRAAVEAIRANDRRIMESGVAEIIEEPIVIDGVLRTFISTKAPFRNAEGRIVGVVGIGHDITDRKQIEADLQQSNDRFYAAMRAVEGIVFEWNLETQTVYRSEGLFDLVGVRAEAAPPTREWWLDRIHPDDMARIEAENPIALAGGDRYEVEYRVRHEAGHWIHVWERGFLKRNSQGDVISVVGFTTDITGRKQAEAALRESEARLHAVAANLPQGAVFIVDRDLRYQLAEGKALAEVGMSSETFVGKTLWEALDPSYAALYEPSYRQALAGSSFRFEHHSHDRHFCSHGVPLYNSQGEVDAVLAVSYDITDRIQAETELRQKNAILDVINESAPTPIFVKDRAGSIIYANPATLEVLGKSANEVIGYRDDELYLSPEDAARVVENDRRIMESGQMEVVEESPDGIRTFLAMKVPYRNEAGEVIGLIGISNDITDRVQLERDRERILQQEQAAREAAESANRIKDEFLAVLSHELRTPLNPILGWTKLLRGGKLDAAKTTHALATIERNAELQTQLIEDLLDVSKILQGKLTLEAAAVNPAATVAAALETVRLAAEAKQIHLEANFAPIAGTVWGDAGRLQQVIWNLLSNAVKFTPNGGSVTVKLEQVKELSSKAVEQESSEAHEPSTPSPLHPSTPHSPLPTPLPSFAQISITDTGKGIHPAFLPHVFDHFRQEDGATTRCFGGLGLGLAIARQLVELHGGTIAADSLGEGQGATFTVKLPLMRNKGEGEMGSWGTNDRLTASLQSTPKEPPHPLSSVRVLVVDDEVDSREFVAFVLEQAGAEVKTAASGREVLELLPTFAPDVLLGDIGMPEMDGYSLMQTIRALSPEQGGRTPAIALTAYARELDQQKALESGFQAHIAKPVESEQLVSAIARLSGQRRKGI